MIEIAVVGAHLSGLPLNHELTGRGGVLRQAVETAPCYCSAGVPAPLCIGTLRLAGSTTPQGLLVEPEGLRGAEEISRFGGWRAFLAALTP